MAAVRREDARIKVPALLHLSRLGYQYLSRRTIRRDPETNILPEMLKAAAERILGTEMSGETQDSLMKELREALAAPDLGRGFTRLIREGWREWRLLDFEHPERNVFHAAAELPCVCEGRRFVPDITLFVNGLPLAMIEVKTKNQAGGIRAEYDRTMERFQSGAFRSFLQAAQIWAFSNDQPWNPERLLPTEGAFFATGARTDFPLYAFREKHPAISRGIPALSPDVGNAILEDNGMPEGSRRRYLSPWTPTHQMLTGLFSPERFLFLLRYGVGYETEREAGEERTEKRLLSSEQLFSLWDLKEKIGRGCRSMAVPACGEAGEAARRVSLLAMTRDCFPGRRIVWILPDRAEARRMEKRLRAEDARGPGSGSAAGETVITHFGADLTPWLRRGDERKDGGRRAFLLTETSGPEARKTRERLRKTDPDAVTILLRRHTAPEGGNYTYLLECADGTFYCGWTNDLESRIRTHNEGRGAKYTRGRRPVRLVYCEEFSSREEAMSREWHIKRMSREEKARLAERGATEKP